MAKDEEFFAQQTRLVLGAMRARTAERFAAAKGIADPLPWIRERPITSVVAAAVGGAVAGFLMIPKAQAAPPKPRHHPLVAHLEVEMLRAIRPFLQSFAASAATSLIAMLHTDTGEPVRDKSETVPQ